MVRSPCCSKEGLNRGPWSAEEDTILTEYIRIHGDGGWRKVPQKAGLNRCGKSCRLRWVNYLRPDIKRGNIASDEEDLIIRMHLLLGNRWSLIAGRLPGRTDNEIRNYWNTHLSKKLSINRSQPNTNTRQNFSDVLQKNVFKTTVPIRITNQVKYSEMVSPNGWKHGSGCSNGISSDHAFKFSSTINESTNPSKSGCNLLVNDSITEDVLAVSNTGVDVNLVETEEVRNFNCSVSTLAVQQSPHCDDFARPASPLGESLCDLKELLSPQCNLLSSPFISWTDFGLEEFCTGLATSLTEETEEPEGMCSNNSFTFADDQGREEIYDNSQHVDWIRELDYI